MADSPDSDRESSTRDDRPSRSGDSGAERRTHLAGERTELAWWRTGLTAIAVALGVGRVLPDLARNPTSWPYELIGVGFALYGIVLIGYGTRRARELEQELGAPRPSRASNRILPLLTAVGMLLGLSTGALILFD
jgi:putative membrane protein